MRDCVMDLSPWPVSVKSVVVVCFFIVDQVFLALHVCVCVVCYVIAIAFWLSFLLLLALARLSPRTADVA